MNFDIGINWDIFHRNNKIVHKFNGTEIETDFEEWREAVVNFSDEVLNFYYKSVPRKFSDDKDKAEFEYFMKEFKKLRTEVCE